MQEPDPGLRSRSLNFMVRESRSADCSFSGKYSQKGSSDHPLRLGQLVLTAADPLMDVRGREIGESWPDQTNALQTHKLNIINAATSAKRPSGKRKG